MYAQLKPKIRYLSVIVRFVDFMANFGNYFVLFYNYFFTKTPKYKIGQTQQ